MKECANVLIMEKRNVVLEKSFEFALSIIEFTEQLEL